MDARIFFFFMFKLAKGFYYKSIKKTWAEFRNNEFS